jgi:hypothetical protein
MSNGISISQSGVPVARAADYQKTIDSRWKFLEVEKEGFIDIYIPAIPAGGSNTLQYNQRFIVIAHKLGYYPLFQTSVSVVKGTPADSQNPGSTFLTPVVLSDNKNLYLFPDYQSFAGQNAITVRVRYRVFAVDISKEYQAPGESPVGASGSVSSIGIKFLDGSGESRINQKSPVGFSADSTKKTLAIHKVTTKDVTSTDNIVVHGVGYPPSYMMCEAPRAVFADHFSGYVIPWRADIFSGPEFNPIVRVTADTSTIKFTGVQAVFQGKYAFVIIKDPIDLSV